MTCSIVVPCDFSDDQVYGYARTCDDRFAEPDLLIHDDSRGDFSHIILGGSPRARSAGSNVVQLGHRS